MTWIICLYWEIAIAVYSLQANSGSDTMNVTYLFGRTIVFFPPNTHRDWNVKGHQLVSWHGKIASICEYTWIPLNFDEQWRLPYLSPPKNSPFMGLQSINLPTPSTYLFEPRLIPNPKYTETIGNPNMWMWSCCLKITPNFHLTSVQVVPCSKRSPGMTRTSLMLTASARICTTASSCEAKKSFKYPPRFPPFVMKAREKWRP